MIARIALESGGACLVLFGLREVFRDIFHPTRSGTLSDFVGRFASLLMRRTRLRPAVGPVSLVSVILCWVIFLTTGFALIYCGLLPQEVSGPPGATSGTFAQRFLKSLYFSLGAFDTFQTFDLSPQTNWLRFVISIEGLIGISMITASVSWLVLLYTALARCRRFAKYVSLPLLPAGAAQLRCRRKRRRSASPPRHTERRFRHRARPHLPGEKRARGTRGRNTRGDACASRRPHLPLCRTCATSTSRSGLRRPDRCTRAQMGTQC
jgi:hypothetical protein